MAESGVGCGQGCRIAAPLPTFPETQMEHSPKGPAPRQDKAAADQKASEARKKEKAEQAEVMGRHKNVGQKDYKGAR